MPTKPSLLIYPGIIVGNFLPALVTGMEYGYLLKDKHALIPILGQLLY
jgi:hypothetical protein